MSCCAIANSTSLNSARRSRLRQRNRLQLLGAEADARIVGGGERLQVEARAARAHRHLVAADVDVEQRVVGQRAQQILQLARGDRRGLPVLAGRLLCAVICISRSVAVTYSLPFPLLEQHVGENRQRVASFNDAGHGLQRFQKRVASDLFELHCEP